MTTAYWAQWSYAELMSMQGVELEDGHKDDYHDDCDYDGDEGPHEHYCSGCIDCLCLSWRDFI
jgi:hypothetical protein